MDGAIASELALDSQASQVRPYVRLTADHHTQSLAHARSFAFACTLSFHVCFCGFAAFSAETNSLAPLSPDSANEHGDMQILNQYECI